MTPVDNVDAAGAAVANGCGAPAAAGCLTGGAEASASDDGSVAPAQEDPFGGVGFRVIGGPEEQDALTCESVGRTSAFANVTYAFPRTRIALQECSAELSEVEESKIKAAAERVTSTGDVLVRKQLVAALGNKIKAVDTESAEVDSVAVDEADVEKALVRLIMDKQLVPATSASANVARGYIIKKFMGYAPVDHWTVKALASADNELDALMKDFINGILRSRTEKTTIDPLPMPCDETLGVPLGDTVHDRIDNRIEFVRGRFYGGWIKSLFTAESFDSYTGEYLLAKLLDTSPNIVWWQRLHTSAGAFIYYNPKDRYFPDFVAMDDEGTHWIIEGKEQRGRTDDVVQKKRAAAEAVVHRLLGEDAFIGQAWGYLIAFEDDIKDSDSWNDLKAKAHPVSNA